MSLYQGFEILVIGASLVLSLRFIAKRIKTPKAACGEDKSCGTCRGCGVGAGLAQELDLIRRDKAPM